MKEMKELMAKSELELARELREAREGLRVFRFEMAGSKIKNVRAGRDWKRKIARIQTAMNSRK